MTIRLTKPKKLNVGDVVEVNDRLFVLITLNQDSKVVFLQPIELAERDRKIISKVVFLQPIENEGEI